jgi:hypothetical protein
MIRASRIRQPTLTCRIEGVARVHAYALFGIPPMPQQGLVTWPTCVNATTEAAQTAVVPY